MNKRHEDDLLQLAFDELPEHKRPDMERLTLEDPEALRTLAAYKDMRDNLKLLNDIPQEQLSTERLRDAILHSGLKPGRDKRVPWVWAPAVAAAAVAMFMLMQTLPRGSSPRIEDSVAYSPRLEPAITQPTLESAEVPAVSARSTATSPVDVQAAAEPVAMSRATKRASSAPVATTSGRSETSDDRRTDRASGAEPSPVAATLAMEAPEEQARPPLVVIHTQEDSMYGASAAMEVESASNVVVGG